MVYTTKRNQMNSITVRMYLKDYKALRRVFTPFRYEKAAHYFARLARFLERKWK